MSIKALGEQASLVATASPETWAFVAAALGEDLERELADPTVLASTSTLVAEIAEEFGCRALIGASSVGERLAAAAVALGQNGLHLRRAGDTDPALIVDGILATGAGVSSAALRLKREGVTRAVAVVVLTTGGADLGPEVDDLVVLTP